VFAAFKEEPFKTQLLAFSYQLSACTAVELLKRFPANEKLHFASAAAFAPIELKAES
jgi:hypothetical protein